MENALEEQWKRSVLDKYLDMSLKGTGASSNSDNKTKTIINSLLLWQVQQIRYMHIALGCVSMALAVWIIGRVWYDSWRATKLQVRLRPRYEESSPFPLQQSLTLTVKVNSPIYGTSILPRASLLSSDSQVSSKHSFSSSSRASHCSRSTCRIALLRLR
jgi:hypothetical protein